MVERMSGKDILQTIAAALTIAATLYWLLNMLFDSHGGCSCSGGGKKGKGDSWGAPRSKGACG